MSITLIAYDFSPMPSPYINSKLVQGVGLCISWRKIVGAIAAATNSVVHSLGKMG
ncbi:MAG: hypothetical protein PUP93_34325 [Rhizonema sp. NSF051]|nr:hypothetical protein [Rhizonema sp. NSF051]